MIPLWCFRERLNEGNNGFSGFGCLTTDLGAQLPTKIGPRGTDEKPIPLHPISILSFVLTAHNRPISQADFI